MEEYLDKIFKEYDDRLLLKLGDYNLLANPHNCIETSTAVGFIMEEFIVSKLEKYTETHDGINEIKIQRVYDRSTANSSYDCYTVYDGVFVMINIKVQKMGKGANNAIAAINILHKDYVSDNLMPEKAYMVFKTLYNFGSPSEKSERQILVNGTNCYYIEELDFSTGHKQDHRNWSMNFKLSSDRLIVAESWRKDHLLNENDISYLRTKKYIENMIKI